MLAAPKVSPASRFLQISLLIQAAGDHRSAEQYQQGLVRGIHQEREERSILPCGHYCYCQQ
jgi:hypothetical protein